MSKKEEASKLDLLVRALFPDDEAASHEEVREFLHRVGCNRDELRSRLQRAARELAATARQKNVAPPPYLQAVVDALGKESTLPVDPSAAKSVALERVRSFLAKTGVPADFRLVEAYRASGAELGQGEQKILEEMRDELRREVDEENESKK
jgi:hypothetical protein